VGAAALIGGLVAPGTAHADASALANINHIVVIYQENHSFDNLYGLWGAVNGQASNGLGATPGTTYANTQKAQNGNVFQCLLNQDPNMSSPTPLATTCTDSTNQAKQGSPATAQNVNSAFVNAPFKIDSYVPPSAATCKNGNAVLAATAGATPGGCTRDLVHRFYQEQYQIDGGKQDRYVTGSDATGLSMGYYDTTQLPIYQYLTGAGAPAYKLLDNIFQGAFGGSFLNHQVLVAAQAPVFANADHSGSTSGCAAGTANCDLHSVVDANGFPNSSYPYYTPTASVADNALTEYANNGQCSPSYATGATAAPAGTLCGDFAVNTIQPYTQPYSPGTAVGRRLPLLTSPNIGDTMSAANVSWKWYSGGWDNAAGNNGRDAMHPLGPGWTAGNTNTSTGTCTNTAASGSVFPNCPDSLFQFHHQPFGYFANYADGKQGRVDHLKDVENFKADAAAGTLPQVSFVKPIGAENEHPGYASEANGSAALVNLIKAVENGPNANDTLIIVTYDEFGGAWDHVAPPGTPGNPGPHDAFGPGTRIPGLLVSPQLGTSGVDHTQYDTTSVLRTIEEKFNLTPLPAAPGVAVSPAAASYARDAYVNSFSSAFASGPTPVVPESRWAVLLPGFGLLAMVGAFVIVRRRPRTA
jgi:acid phosphatase